MSDHQRPDLLHDFVDGDLDAEARRAVEAHLDACAECRREVAAIQALKAAAGELPTDVKPRQDLWPGIHTAINEPGALLADATARLADEIQPGRDLWTGIQEAIDQPYPALASATRRLPAEIEPPRDLWAGIRDAIRRPRILYADFVRSERYVRLRRLSAAAAVLLIAGASSATTLFLMGRFTPEEVVETRALPEPAPRQVALVEGVYQAAIADLMSELRQRRGQMAPETRAVIERNLAVIDAAIRSSRVALGADPADPRPLETMQTMCRKKVELLRRAVRLPAGT